MIRALLLLASLFLSAATADELAVPLDVVSVTTVGYWQTESQSGTYRVVVTQNGWEHVWSRVYVQWLPQPKSSGEDDSPVVVAELIPPIAQGAFVLEATARRIRTNKVMVTVKATPNLTAQAKSSRFVFSVGEPGVVQLLAPAKQ